MLLLSAIGPAIAPGPPERVRVMVAFRGEMNPGLVRGLGGVILGEIPVAGVVVAGIPSRAMEALANRPGVAYVEPDHEVHALGETLPWGVDRIDADLAHPGITGQGVTVAVIDTGIDYDHPDLDANYLGGKDFVNDDPDPMDDNGHGTHCAGTIAAEDNEQGVIGVAPDAKLLAVKVLDSSGSGYTSDVVAGIYYAIDTGANVISMSLGSDYPSSTLEKACDDAYQAGIVVVAAAGNDYQRRGRSELDTVDYPGRYSSVIAVGATDQYDEKASFSSTGPDVELAAPGVNIPSTYSGGGLATGSGTSMACPHVAGTAALVIAATGMDGAGVRARLIDTAEDLGSTGRDSWYGYGLVDAEAAADGANPNSPPTAEAGGPYSGDEDAAIAFSGSGSDPDGDSLTYSWDFGDGSTGTGATPSHTYLWGGDFEVGLTVSDGRGGTAIATATASVAEVNDLPVADAGGPYDGTVGSAITFDGSGSSDYDNEDGCTTNDQTITYSWDFGDESTDGGETTSHAYDAAGTYTVTLTVSDGTASDTSTSTVAVTAQPTSMGIHVGEIVMDGEISIRGRNTFCLATATILILDESGNPVVGATVHGFWSDAYSETVSAATSTEGMVTFQTNWVKGGGTFAFTVENVVKEGCEYDSGSNTKTGDTISLP